MEAVLNNLRIPLTICWASDPSKSVHGELKNNIIFIYDKDETVAWETFNHELLEYKIEMVTEVYRALVNSLIEGFEKLYYRRKEEVLDCLPQVMKTVQKLEPNGSGKGSSESP